MEPALLIGIFLVFGLAFANGSNDVSKGIATLAGSGVTDYRKAIMWGTVWTVLGGMLGMVFSMAMVKTFTSGILSQPMVSMPMAVPVAVILGAAAWVLFASRVGLPVSTTHAITGALCGAGLAGWGMAGIQWLPFIKKVVLPLAVSPLLAFALVFLVAPLVEKWLKGWQGHCFCILPAQKSQLAVEPSGRIRMIPTETKLFSVVDSPHCDEPSQVLSLRVGPDTFHWMTSGLTSLARGLNDAPKMVALLVGLSLFAGQDGASVMSMGFVLVAVGMGLGSYLGGLRVTRFLAERVTRMDHLEGFSANLATAILVTFAARMGFPVSTTHLSSSALMGIGLRKGPGHLQWGAVREMIMAWVVTIPVAGLLAAGCYWLLVQF